MTHATNIKGDILELEYDSNSYIIQQCNCLAIKPHGLSASISKKFSYADFYSLRSQLGKRNLATHETRSIPGTIGILHNNSNTSPHIVALYAQYDFGKVNSYYGERPDEYSDTTENRYKWFKKSLRELRKTLKNKSLDNNIKYKIYFPFKIGCGLAGGDWKKYSKAIDKFAMKGEKYYNVFIVDNS